MQEEKFNEQDGNFVQPNVNESLALAGLFRRVFVKDRLPKHTDIYYTNLGKTPFFDDEKIMVLNNTRATWWLEKVEFPTQDEIENERTGRNYQTFQFD